ncbi:beta,beta-carotene 15,15'-dioxygenase-like [Palaemon carinicauda]|uniref:Beta-carotene oxygenase 2 n=1 Tax=Palaemon carinicauda TaxID=392227 RepID=A0A6C0X766_PALCI|nr:beta-carotene oxygenase 2 [Palaemon carinicauda]QNU40509.1 EcBCO-like1 [Palaemon carinicauda]
MELFKENFHNAEECVEPVLTKSKGEIPSWLCGSFVRVGPGKFDLSEDFSVNHWMDGLAIMYKFSINGGQVSFRSKYLRSDAYKKACVAQKPIFTEFGTHSYPDPSKNIFSRMISTFDAHVMTDNCSNTVTCIEDNVFVATETCFIRRVDPVTLDTKEKVDLNKYTSVNFASSHPLTDASGATYNLGSSFMGGPKYHVLRVPPSDEKKNCTEPWMNARVVANIPSSWRASFGYNHSFGMSENYIVFCEQPMLLNTLKLATSQVKSKSLHECMEWHPQEKVKFIVLNKNTGEVQKVNYICDKPFLVFHHANTYEEKGHLVVDLVAYPNPEILNKLYLNKVKMNEYNKEDPPQLVRFVLPLVHDIQSVPEGQELVTIPGTDASAIKVREGHIQVTGMDIGEPGWDMPTINKAYSAKPYHYVYGTGGWDQGYYKNAVSKIDVDSGRTWLWRGTEYQYLSEPIFVGAPNAIDEDDGVLLASVCDVQPGKSDFMLVLDARTMEEIARCEVSAKVPNGLHGIFLPDKF